MTNGQIWAREHPELARALGENAHAPRKVVDAPKRPATAPSRTGIVIVIPMPPRATHPNSRGGWQAKSAATKRQRNQAATAARAALGLSYPPLWTHVSVQATFHKPGKRAKRADGDGLNAWLKASIDGLQDAGIVANDSGVVLLPSEQVIGDAASEAKVVLVVKHVESNLRANP